MRRLAQLRRFMEMALYEPGLTPQRQCDQAGAGGVRPAPEAPSLFSRCPRPSAANLRQVSGGSILELGAGSGVMAADLLNELAAQGPCPSAT
jgi:SAM-dependent MidA family methyltransferase